MNLINHDESQIAEQGRNLHMFIDHQRLQRFGCDLQNTRGLLQKPSLPRLCRVSVPSGDSNPGFFTQFIQPPELIVDQCLQRSDVQNAYAPGWFLIQKRQDGKESRFGFTRGSRRSQKNILVRAEDCFSRRVLNAPKRLPAGAVNIILYKWCIPFEYIHSLLSFRS